MADQHAFVIGPAPSPPGNGQAGLHLLTVVTETDAGHRGEDTFVLTRDELVDGYDQLRDYLRSLADADLRQRVG